MQPEPVQRLGGPAGRISLVADHHHPQTVAHGLRGAMAALRVQPPFQLVPFDDQGPRDQPVPRPQFRVADVHEQRALLGRRLRLLRSDPLVSGPDPLQELVDPDPAVPTLVPCVAHCQSSGRSVCSRRSTAPVRL